VLDGYNPKLICPDCFTTSLYSFFFLFHKPSLALRGKLVKESDMCGVE
jgi:hypothetical protein